MNAFRFAVLAGISSLFLVFGAAAAPTAPPSAEDFTFLEGFPEPALSASSVSADVRGNGALIVYDGERIHLEDAPETDSYTNSFGGFAGEPGFVAAAADGTAALVSAGSSGSLWLVDLTDPAPAGEPFWTLENTFAGKFLGGDTVLVDREKPVGEHGLYASELGIVDLSVLPTGNTQALYTKVVQKPATGSASAGLVIYDNTVYSADGLTGEVRAFPLASILAAWADKTPIAWNDGTRVGRRAFNLGGPQGVSGQGTLLIGGINPRTGNSSIQFVSTAGELGGELVIPQADPSPYYEALYNPATSKILVTATSFNTEPLTVNAYVSNDVYEETLPPPRTLMDSIMLFLQLLGAVVLVLLLLLVLI